VALSRDVVWHRDQTETLLYAQVFDGIALDDFINPKVGRQIFGCETIFDHAAKAIQSRYPWGTEHCLRGVVETYQRTLGMPVSGLSFLPAEKDHSSPKRDRHHPRESTAFSNQTGAGRSDTDRHRDVVAYDQVVMLKSLQCPVRVVWVFRKTRWVAMFATDLDLCGPVEGRSGTPA